MRCAQCVIRCPSNNEEQSIRIEEDHSSSGWKVARESQVSAPIAI